MESNIEMINNYFALNKIEVEKSSKILGTLEFVDCQLLGITN